MRHSSHLGRMRIFVRLAGIACLLSIAGPACADDPTPDAPYRYWPVTTDLQRRLVGNEMSVLLLLNADALCEGDLVDAGPLDLTRPKPNAAKPDGSQKLLIRFFTTRGVDAEEKSRRLLELALTAHVVELGYAKPRVSWTYSHAGEPFDKVIRGLELPDDVEGAEEPISENDQFWISTPRTPLTRYLIGKSDCFITLLEPWDEETDADLTDDLKAALREAIEAANPSGRAKLMLDVQSRGEAGRKAVDVFVETRKNDLARELGFDGISVRHSPGR